MRHRHGQYEFRAWLKNPIDCDQSKRAHERRVPPSYPRFYLIVVDQKVVRTTLFWSAQRLVLRETRNTQSATSACHVGIMTDAPHRYSPYYLDDVNSRICLRLPQTTWSAQCKYVQRGSCRRSHAIQGHRESYSELRLLSLERVG